MLDGEGFHQVLRVGLREEEIDLRIGGEPRDEDEAVGEDGAHFAGAEVELIAAEFGHHHVADDGVVLVGPDFHEGFVAVIGHIDEEIFVGEDPLEGGRELLIVIDEEQGLEFDRVGRTDGGIGLGLEIHLVDGRATEMPRGLAERAMAGRVGRGRKRGRW